MEYDVAQICRNGHISNKYFNEKPEKNKNFCSICGNSNMTTCPNCNNTIRGGSYWIQYGVPRTNPEPLEIPAYCEHCGSAFPWTVERITAAKELVDELEGLSDEEREVLSKSIDDITSDNPRTKLAGTRIKKILTRVGGPVTTVFKGLLVEIASETAKKVLTGTGSE